MEKVVSVTEMQAIEREADAKGLNYAQMMENAGRGMAELIQNAHSHSGEQSIVALVGSGNNGGDALVALSVLADLGWRVNAYLVKPRQENDALVERVTQRQGGILRADGDVGYQELQRLLEIHSVLIDGVLGTGIKLPLHGDVAACLAVVRNYVVENPGKLRVVAVDCPSGVDCDTGLASEETIPAAMTVTMAAIKRGLLSLPAADLTGDLRVVSIGDLGEVDAWKKINCWMADDTYVKQVLPARPRNAHKGTFGTALIVAGSINYTGAAFLAGRAAYRVGAGLVQMAVPAVLHSALAGQMPEVIWLPLAQQNGFIASEASSEILNNSVKVSAILMGPGFGLQATTQEFVRRLLTEGGHDLPPMVVDADGLKMLSAVPDWYRQLPSPVVLTPHPGEMAILSGLSVEQIQSERVSVAQRYAELWGQVVVLKGAFTVIAAPDGKVVINPIATAALARAGTGDVLAGLIAGLMAQGVKAFEAASAGVWMHAAAGLKAERELGAASVLAGDVLENIPKVLLQLNQGKVN
jgi:NAD(P)H-hydrate epimerase